MDKKTFHVTSTSPQTKLKEGDTLLETAVGQMLDGSFVWRARGKRVKDFYEKTQGPMSLQDGWLICGPFKTEKAAIRSLNHFERDHMEWAFPNMEVRDAPNPQSLN